MDTSRKLEKAKGRADGGPYSCTTTTSGSKSSVSTLIEYDIDGTLDIKEEIIQVPEIITVQKQNKTYESKLCTVQRKEDILDVNRKPLALKEKIPASKQERKYACKKCARTYKMKSNLKRHLQYECDVTPQFRCKFCDKLFKWKFAMKSHVDCVHSITSRHLQTEKQLMCDYCQYKSNRKSSLRRHITLRHSQAFKKRFKCNKCSRSYIWLQGLIKHKLKGHVAVKKQFICDYCEYHSNRKGNLRSHITLCHLQTKKQLRCNYCEYKSNQKSSLTKHITSSHSQASKSMYKCDKCARNYSCRTTLTRHKRLVHSLIKA